MDKHILEIEVRFGQRVKNVETMLETMAGATKEAAEKMQREAQHKAEREARVAAIAQELEQQQKKFASLQASLEFQRDSIQALTKQINNQVITINQIFELLRLQGLSPPLRPM